jgi:hypothetical protein
MGLGKLLHAKKIPLSFQQKYRRGVDSCSDSKMGGKWVFAVHFTAGQNPGKCDPDEGAPCGAKDAAETTPPAKKRPQHAGALDIPAADAFPPRDGFED